MDTPFLRAEDGGEVFPLRDDVTTVGRGRGVDIRLDDPSVSRLHAELVRRGPYVYVVAQREDFAAVLGPKEWCVHRRPSLYRSSD